MHPSCLFVYRKPRMLLTSIVRSSEWSKGSSSRNAWKCQLSNQLFKYVQPIIQIFRKAGQPNGNNSKILTASSFLLCNKDESSFSLSIRDRITQEMCSDLVMFRAPNWAATGGTWRARLPSNLPVSTRSRVFVIDRISERRFGENSAHEYGHDFNSKTLIYFPDSFSQSFTYNSARAPPSSHKFPSLNDTRTSLIFADGTCSDSQEFISRTLSLSLGCTCQISLLSPRDFSSMFSGMTLQYCVLFRDLYLIFSMSQYDSWRIFLSLEDNHNTFR